MGKIYAAVFPFYRRRLISAEKALDELLQVLFLPGLGTPDLWTLFTLEQALE